MCTGKKSLRIYTSMHSGRLELTKLTYSRHEDNLLRHGGIPVPRVRVSISYRSRRSSRYRYGSRNRSHRIVGYGFEVLTESTEASGKGNTAVNTPGTLLYVPNRTQPTLELCSIHDRCERTMHRFCGRPSHVAVMICCYNRIQVPGIFSTS